MHAKFVRCLQGYIQALRTCLNEMEDGEASPEGSQHSVGQLIRDLLSLPPSLPDTPAVSSSARFLHGALVCLQGKT